MTQKVPISDTGTATLGISAARQRRRNSSTTSTTAPTAMTSVSSASCNEARMLGVVLRHRHLDVGRHQRGQHGQLGAHRIHRLDDVGVGLAPQDHQDGLAVVEEARLVEIFNRILDLGHVRHAHRRAVAPATISGLYCSARLSWSLTMTCQ